MKNYFCKIGQVFLLILGLDVLLFAQENQVRPNPTIKFPAGKTSLHIPFNNDLGLIYVKLRINDSRPLLFNLDTGFDVSIIDATVAKKLKLKLENIKVVPVPGGSIEMGNIPTAKVNFGDLLVTGQPLQTAPLASLAKFVGHDFDGILGHDFINLFAVEIDYQNNFLTLHLPNSFEYKGKGEAIPVNIIKGEPFINANILEEGRPRITAKLKIDTGGISGIGFNKNFIEANKLPDANEKVLNIVGLSVGGDTKNIVFKIKGFQIGSYILYNLFVGATIDSAGFENRNDAGTFGGEILTHFNIVLDYTRQRIIFEPNANFSNPFIFDRTGLFFTAEGVNYKTFRIYSMLPNSPAEEAGLKVGDSILSVNNLTASQLNLDKLWQMMRAKEGTVYQFKVKRGGKLIHTNLKLRSLL